MLKIDSTDASSIDVEDNFKLDVFLQRLKYLASKNPTLTMPFGLRVDRSIAYTYTKQVHMRTVYGDITIVQFYEQLEQQLLPLRTAGTTLLIHRNEERLVLRLLLHIFIQLEGRL